MLWFVASRFAKQKHIQWFHLVASIKEKMLMASDNGIVPMAQCSLCFSYIRCMLLQSTQKPITLDRWCFNHSCRCCCCCYCEYLPKPRTSISLCTNKVNVCSIHIASVHFFLIETKWIKKICINECVNHILIVFFVQDECCSQHTDTPICFSVFVLVFLVAIVWWCPLNIKHFK